MPARILDVRIAAIAVPLYFAYYVFFTGVVEVSSFGRFLVEGTHLEFVQIVSGTYNGPGIQLVGSSFIVTIRTIPLLLSLALSAAIGTNVSLFHYLYRNGGLRACFYGGLGGVGALLSNLASFSYLCCGWALSLVLIGSTFLATLSAIIGVASLLLLGLNAYILWNRSVALTGTLKRQASPDRL